MSQMYERVINVIKKSPDQRQQHEVEIIIPWLRKKSQLLQSMKKDVIVDIIRNCYYQHNAADHVVIKQGESGECFYIIVNGSVSVYIDPNLSGESALKDKEEKEEQKEIESAEELDNVEQDENETESNTQGVTEEEEEEEYEDDGEKDEDRDEEGDDISDDDEADDDEEEEKQSKNRTLSVKSSAKPPKSSKSTKSTKSSKAAKTPKKPRLNRSLYGNYIVSFGSGKSFGEIALISEDNIRNASIITDEETDFLVIHRDLYNRCLKAAAELEFKEKNDFVENHPFFCTWTPKMQSLLKMSIRKESYSFDTPIVRQGEPVVGLHFMLNGQAKFVVEPGKHKGQYPDRHPFQDSADVYSGDWMPKRKRLDSSNNDDPNKSTVKQESVRVRRRDGYAAAEKKLHGKSMDLCFVRDREIIGDIEIAMNLDTYFATVICTTNTQAFLLDLKTYERLIIKKNKPTIETLTLHAETKLMSRVTSLQGSQVPLLRHLAFKLHHQEETQPKKTTPLRNSKELPDKEVLIHKLLQWFVRDRAPLIEPMVPGAVFYKDIMEEKAKRREGIRAHRKKMERKNMLPSTLRKDVSQDSRKPRSITALKDVIKRMKEKGVIDSGQPKPRTFEQHSQEIDTLLSKPKQEWQAEKERKRQEVVEQERLKREDNNTQAARRASMHLIFAAAKVDQPPVSKESDTVETSPRISASGEQHGSVSATNLGQGQGQAEATKQSNSPSLTSPSGENLNTGDVEMKTGDGGNQSIDRPIVELPTKSNGSPTPSNATKPSPTCSVSTPVTGMRRMSDPEVSKVTSGKPFLPVIQERPQTEEKATRDLITTLQKITLERERAKSQPEEPERRDSLLPDLEVNPVENPSSMGLKRPRGLKFFNAIVRNKIRLLEKQQAFRDWETSDKILSYLEERVKRFSVNSHRHAKSAVSLPQLRRYNIKEGEINQPKPGGKVMIKKQTCPLTQCRYHIKDHEHIRYHMVEALPNKDKIQKARVMVQMLMEKSIEKKLQQESTPKKTLGQWIP
ncbi:uncharacterized protein LOC106179668 [Lingula anatina]|uniref:Uncharacterized protein LOC106179668 n=1 Tax=Lingula anatina TaxID=7574 RepID=A0A1S3K8T1_LINAN|nr:uncharacterized protein LOC106179668 [Lingula anatina]|eukprot:XP_013418849.1 uncharacterized protein LOC106179668 [Lingula anatina]